MLGLINKARAHILVWANQERAECFKEGGVSSRGWQRQTPSSWSVWTGTQRHTGLAAGVPDGSLESPYLQCWLLFMLFTTLTKPTSVPWHPQACTAGWMEALVKAFLFLKGRQERRRLIFSQKVLQMNTIASVNGQLLDHQSGSHDVHAFLSHETCSERFTIRCCPWSVASCSVHTPTVQ